MYVPRAMYSLRMSFWVVPAMLAAGHALGLRRGDVQREQDRRRRVDGHRRRDVTQRQAIEQHRHVRQAGDRDADPADLALRGRGVGVVAHLGRQVEGDRQAGLALLQQVAEPPVGLLGRREPRVLAHRPEAAAVHGRLDAAGERVLARPAEVARLVETGRVGGRVQVPDLDARGRLERRTALRGRLRPPWPAASRASARGRGRLPSPIGRSGSAHSMTRSRSPISMVSPAATATRVIDAVARGAQLVLHLHRLDHEQLLARHDGLAGLDGHAHDPSGDDGMDLGRSATGGSPRDRAWPGRGGPPGAPIRCRARSASHRPRPRGGRRRDRPTGAPGARGGGGSWWWSRRPATARSHRRGAARPRGWPGWGPAGRGGQHGVPSTSTSSGWPGRSGAAASAPGPAAPPRRPRPITLGIGAIGTGTGSTTMGGRPAWARAGASATRTARGSGYGSAEEAATEVAVRSVVGRVMPATGRWRRPGRPDARCRRRPGARLRPPRAPDRCWSSRRDPSRWRPVRRPIAPPAIARTQLGGTIPVLPHPPCRQVPRTETLVAGHAPVERQGRLQPADLGLIERPSQSGDGLVAIAGVDHDLGDQVVVLGRDPLAGFQRRIHANARSRRA